MLFSALRSGHIEQNDIPVAEVSVSPDDQLILCSDGVWEGVPKEDSNVQKILQTVDEIYTQDVKNGMPIAEAAMKAYGEIFRQVNLAGVSQEATGDQLVNHLTRKEVGAMSRDNVSAVVMESSPSTP